MPRCQNSHHCFSQQGQSGHVIFDYAAISILTRHCQPLFNSRHYADIAISSFILLMLDTPAATPITPLMLKVVRFHFRHYARHAEVIFIISQIAFHIVLLRRLRQSAIERHYAATPRHIERCHAVTLRLIRATPITPRRHYLTLLPYAITPHIGFITSRFTP